MVSPPPYVSVLLLISPLTINLYIMNKQITEEVEKLSEQVSKMCKTRERMINLIRANENAFEDDILLCRCVAELSAEILRLEDVVFRRETLNSLNLFDVVEK